jgi:hypothetical protein
MNANPVTGYSDRGPAIVVYFVPTVRSHVLSSSGDPVIASSFLDWEIPNMDVKMAIQTGNFVDLQRLLAEDPTRADELIPWGKNRCILTHPLHYISDMLFDGTLPKGKELPLVDALVRAGANVNFQKPGKGETPLIGAASLAAEDVGIALLDAGADPTCRGTFGETALHWAAMLGEDRLAARLLPGSDVDLKDQKYGSSPLGWAIHGWSNPPAGSRGHQREVILLLFAAGAQIDPEWLKSEKVCSDSSILSMLQTRTPPAT